MAQAGGEDPMAALAEAFQRLAQAIEHQSQAIETLAQVIAAQYLEDEEASPATYLDGTPAQ